MSTQDRDYSEKRDFIRMHVEAEGILTVQGEKYVVMCKDLSATGVQIEVPQLGIKQGMLARIEIPSAHADLQGLKAEVEVVRVQNLEQGRQSLGLAIRTLL